MKGEHGDRWHMEAFKPLSWICTICESGNDDTFTNSESLLSHMEEVHTNMFTIDQLRIISRQSKTQVARPRGRCLLCSFDVHGLLQKKKTVKIKSKVSRLSKDMESPGPHIADADVADNPHPRYANLKGREEPHTQDDLEHISEHIGEHLQVLMLTTMRLASLQNMEENISEDFGSETVETDGNGTIHDPDSSDIFGSGSDEDAPIGEDDEEISAAETRTPLGIEVARDDDEETSDFHVEWAHIPLPNQVPVEEDAFLQSAARSGAFQAHQQGFFPRGYSDHNTSGVEFARDDDEQTSEFYVEGSWADVLFPGHASMQLILANQAHQENGVPSLDEIPRRDSLHTSVRSSVGSIERYERDTDTDAPELARSVMEGEGMSCQDPPLLDEIPGENDIPEVQYLDLDLLDAFHETDYSEHWEGGEGA